MRRLAQGMAVCVAAVATAILAARVMVPDPCLYHTGEYLGDKPLPWWVTTFFTLDGLRHPQASPLLFAIFMPLGGLIADFSINSAERRTVRKEP